MTNEVNNELPSSEEIKKSNEELIAMGLDPVQDPRAPDYVMSGGKNEYPLLIMENICRLLESDEYKGKLRFNEFSHSTEVLSEQGVWDDMSDGDIFNLQRWVSSDYQAFAKVSREMVTSAMLAISRNQIINPPKDYLKGLVWDKKPRLATWLNAAFGAPADDLYDAIGSNWMKGCIKRVLHPGCQFDEVLVLEGSQGTRKSSALRALGSPWHVETTYSSDKDFFQVLAKNVIVEFSEGDILSRAGVRQVKALITKTEDQYRSPYGRTVDTIKRGCVFAMTTNDTDYLKDETGNRRWLPVRLTKQADVDWITKNRDQLYAEAVHRVETLHETTWEYPKDDLDELQESRTTSETHMEEIEDWYLGLSMTKRRDGVTIKEGFVGAIAEIYEHRATPMMDKNVEWEIARAYKKMGLNSKTVRLGDLKEKIARRWIFSEDTKRRYKGRWADKLPEIDEKDF